MTLTTHTLGYPRIGVRRELKKALEAYWTGEIDQAQLEQAGREMRLRHWAEQQAAGDLRRRVPPRPASAAPDLPLFATNANPFAANSYKAAMLADKPPIAAPCYSRHARDIHSLAF